MLFIRIDYSFPPNKADGPVRSVIRLSTSAEGTRVTSIDATPMLATAGLSLDQHPQ